MSLTVTAIPGFQFATNQKLTRARLNLLGQPTFTITGTIGTSDIAAGAVISGKSAAGPYWYATTTYDTSSGLTPATSNRYTLSFTGSTAPNGLVDGLVISMKAAAANANGDGSVSLIVFATEKRVYKFGGTTNLRPNDIQANQMVELRYNQSSSGYWEIQSPTGQPDAEAYVTGQALNFTAGNNASAPTSQIDLTFDEIVLRNAAGRSLRVSNSSNTTYTINTATIGAVNGSEASLVGVTDWRYLYVISNGVTVGGFVSPFASGVTLPSGYEYRARVGYVYVAAGSLSLFHQNDRDVFLGQNTNIALSSGISNSWLGLRGATIKPFFPTFAKTATFVIGMDATGNLNYEVGMCALNADGSVNAVGNYMGRQIFLIGYWHAGTAGTSTNSSANVLTGVAAATFRVPVRGGTWGANGWDSSVYGVQYAIGNGTSTPGLLCRCTGYSL